MGWADDTVDDLLSAIEDQADTLGPQIVDDARDALSKAYPPASEPGESPHRRTGNLLGSTSSTVTVDAADSTVQLVIYWTSPYAGFLEDGTDNNLKARPFAAPLFVRWSDPVTEKLGGAVAAS